MVMTTSDARTADSISALGRAPVAVRSIPISRIASTTVGLLLSAGAVPADRTSILPSA
jgi:hypothetical protein